MLKVYVKVHSYREKTYFNSLRPSDAYMRQAIIWTNAGILFMGPVGTNSSEI